MHFLAVIGGRVLKREYVRTSTDMSIFGPPPQLAPAMSEPLPEGLQPQTGGGLRGLPPQTGGGLRGLPPQTGGGLRGLPEEPFAEGMEPYPDDLAPLPHPEDVDPVPLPDSLQNNGEKLEPLPQPAGLDPLPHPEGLEPIPEGEHPPELPPLPLPEDLTPEAEHTGDVVTTSAPDMSATIEATTLATSNNKTTSDATVSPTKGEEEASTGENRETESSNKYLKFEMGGYNNQKGLTLFNNVPLRIRALM